MFVPFLQQESDVFFQQDDVRPHMAAAMQRALRGVQHCPGQQDPQIFRQLNTYGT